MANVQLEHGHVRIANALEEAIIFAKFSVTQMKIVRCIIRLTWGWRARTVRISHQDLAVRCNTTAAGGFRKEFTELVREHVILQVEEPHGRTPGVYAINKDFEKWGRLSVPASALNALFGDRPETANKSNRVPSTGQSMPSPESDRVPSAGHSTEADRVPSEGQSNSRKVPSNEPEGALNRAPYSTGKGTLISVSDCNDSELAPPKDSIRQRKTTSESHARAGARAEASYAGRLVDTAVTAIGEKWPTTVAAIQTTAAELLASDLIATGVDLDLACAAVGNRIRHSKQPEPPASISYFREAILDAHRLAEHEELKHSGDTNGARRGGRPSRVAAIVDPDAAEKRDQLERDYRAEKRAAAIAWGKDPANAAAYQVIVAAANERLADFLHTKYGPGARDQDVIERCQSQLDFPDFDAWCASRQPDAHQEVS